MKIYFQNLSQIAQQEVQEEIMAHLGFDGKEATYAEKQWIDEQVADYINRNNFGVEFSMANQGCV